MSSSRKQSTAGTKAPFPGFIEPALASSIEKVPFGARWIHEIKFDGYRVQLHIANDDIKVFTSAAFDHARRLAQTTDLQQAMQLQSEFMKELLASAQKQMQQMSSTTAAKEEHLAEENRKAPSAGSIRG